MDYSLSDKDIKKLIPGVKVVPYFELHNYHNIDELLYPNGKVALLYNLKPNGYGHWTAIFVRDGVLHFFDSYGKVPDTPDRFRNTDTETLFEMNETKPYLLELMRDSRYKKLDYNDFKFQGPKSSTCGRWTALRLALWYMTDKKFKEFIKSFGDDYDKTVTIITKKYLGK